MSELLRHESIQLLPSNLSTLRGPFALIIIIIITIIITKLRYMGEGPPDFYLFQLKVSCPRIEYAFLTWSRFQTVDPFKKTIIWCFEYYPSQKLTSSPIWSAFISNIEGNEQGSDKDLGIKCIDQGQGFGNLAWTLSISAITLDVTLTLHVLRTSWGCHDFVAPKTALATRGCLRTKAAKKNNESKKERIDRW